jgi:predicted dehydrogenase
MSGEATARPTLKAGMVGMGMIFDETYRPFFERTHAEGLYSRAFGDCDVPLTAVASRTGKRAEAYRKSAGNKIAAFESFAGENSVEDMLQQNLSFACVATPDDRHFEASKKVLEAGAHLLVEKPSVLSLSELDALTQLAKSKTCLRKSCITSCLIPIIKSCGPSWLMACSSTSTTGIARSWNPS